MSTLEDIGKLVAQEERQAERLDELLETPSGTPRWRQLTQELGLPEGLGPGALQTAFRPLSPEQEVRLVGAVVARQQQLQLHLQSQEPSSSRVSESPAGAEAASPVAPVAPLHRLPARSEPTGEREERSSRARVALGARSLRWAPPLLLAAAALLFWVLPSPTGDLPEYTLQLSGAAESRAESPPEQLALRPGGSLRLSAQPLRATDEAPPLQAWLRSNGQSDLVALEVAALERAPTGALRATLTLPGSLPSAGELWVVVGAPPPGLEGRSALPPNGSAFRAWSRPFRRVAGSP